MGTIYRSRVQSYSGLFRMVLIYVFRALISKHEIVRFDLAMSLHE